MKKWIVSIALASNIFASSISENLAYKEEPAKKEENIGHFLLSVGVTTANDDLYIVYPTVAFGYQSKITTAPIFQAAGIELEIKMPGVKSLNTSIEKEVDFSTFRIYGMHYFIKEGAARYFFAPGLTTSQNKLYAKEDKTGLQYITVNMDLSCALGVESGAPSGMINRFLLRLEYPILNYASNYFVPPTPKLLCSFGIGF